MLTAVHQFNYHIIVSSRTYQGLKVLVIKYPVMIEK